MNEPEAADYLNAKSVACKATDPIPGRDEGIRQFLDEKSYRPGLGQLDLKKAAARVKSASGQKTSAGKKAAAKKAKKTARKRYSD